MAAGRRSRWVHAVCLAAALLGLKLGFDFGQQLAGLWLGLVMGANGAVFCAIVTDIVTDALLRRGRSGVDDAA
jgi:hypothetical protein